jgi:hypothetical protein
VTLHLSKSHLVRCLATVLIAIASTTASASDKAEFNKVLELYQQAKFAGAYGRFCALADRGDPDAALIALFMLRYGTQLYSSDWGASQGQIDRWIALAARNPVHRIESGGD